MLAMIKSYRGKDTKRFITGKPSKLPPEITERAAMKLIALSRASLL
jgi:hypothetical protein